MDTIADIYEPASELERLIAELSGSGPLVFVFGDGLSTAHLKGVTTPVFRGPADRRWWHVVLGDDTASWTMDVRVKSTVAGQHPALDRTWLGRSAGYQAAVDTDGGG